jgi:hypothetical protein
MKRFSLLLFSSSLPFPFLDFMHKRHSIWIKGHVTVQQTFVRTLWKQRLASNCRYNTQSHTESRNSFLYILYSGVCYNEHRCYNKHGGILSADVARAST